MKTLKNIKMNLLVATMSQIMTVVFALIVPRLMISYYGAQIHGLISVITGLITYLTLIESGLSAASIQGLYKPLNEKNKYEINAGLNAISRFYSKIGILFSLAVILTAFIYPFIASRELEYSLVTILILISGLAQTIEYLFCSKYKVLLQADKKLYIVNLINTIGIIIQGFLRIGMILLRFNIYFVQLIPAIIYIMRLILIRIYIKKYYTYLDPSIPPNYEISKKRWNALIHQICNLVVNNTDSIVLSTFVGYTSVSIYSIYQMVISNLNGFLNQALSNAITANFGHIISSNNISECNIYYRIYEKIYYYIIAVIFGVCSVMIIPFVDVYTSKLSINYVDNVIAFLFIINAVLSNLRIPQLTMVTAAGRFKETQNHAILEACINIVISLLLVKFIGIYGVLIGTTCSYLVRDCLFVWYTNKKILHTDIYKSIGNIVKLIIYIIIIFLFGQIIIQNFYIRTWVTWLISACITFLCALIIVLIGMIIFDNKLYKYFKKNFLKDASLKNLMHYK